MGTEVTFRTYSLDMYTTNHM